MTLWGGRFTTKLDEKAWNLNTSLPFDQRMAKQDVKGSIAWCDAIFDSGVIDEPDHAKILTGLTTIFQEFEQNSFKFLDTDEDIHSAVERRLGEIIGEPAGKLHTGRSRNDQVATDFRLWMLEMLPQLDASLKAFQQEIVNISERNTQVLLPGYTHLQRAQPITLAHWFMSFFWMLQRDRERFSDLKKRVSILPLGCGAMAGTGFLVDREKLSDALGFDRPAPNSLDAVSDRDFAAEFLFCAAMTGTHLSKLSEAMVLFTTAEFGFFELSDAFSTGSSLMPQKKNADLFELTRGKAGTLLGLLTGLMATLKGLPSTYDKDLQEDKMPVFQAADTLLTILPVLTGALSSITVKKDRMMQAIDPTMMATDLADYLVRKGIPFREAHKAVGKVVRWAVENNVKLDVIPLAKWQEFGPFDADVFKVFDPMTSINQHASVGGTAIAAVADQITASHKILANS